MDTEYDDDATVRQSGGDNASNASVHQSGVPPSLFWGNTILSAIGAFAGIIALVLVLTRLNDYHDSLALEKRLQTQAIDELRVEANVSRRLAGLPTIDAQEHD